MKIARIITGVAVVLLVALAVGLVFKFTNGFNEDFKTFYLERDGEQILSSETETAFARGEEYRYEVKYTFDSDDAEPKGYSVKVVPNGKVKITFKVGNKQYSYAEANELTEAFTIKKEASAFTLAIPENQSLQSVLEKVYGKTVEVEEPQGNLYTLVVSSYNEKVTYNIHFCVETKVNGIELDKDGIVFGGDSVAASNNPNGTPSEPAAAAEYAITYEIAYSFDDTPITVECPVKAKVGEVVEFTAIPEHKYEDYGVWAEVYDKASGEFLYYAKTVSYGYCSFEMPSGNVHLKIYHV
ncbi:MAG: hypothetical protein NC548_35490 [Lachnospiraceae bacterium]|nr:hypothetical protein [Lachnospiraceae bacterium]